MFRTVPLSIIRSLSTAHSAMVYVIQVRRQLSSRTRMEMQFHPGPARKLSTGPGWNCCSILVGSGLLNYRWVFSTGRFFYRVPLPAARQTPNLEDQWLERSNFRRQVSHSLKRRERTPAAEGGSFSFIHSVFCLTTGPKPPPKRCLHIVRSRASSFKWEYPLLSLRSSSSLDLWARNFREFCRKWRLPRHFWVFYMP